MNFAAKILHFFWLLLGMFCNDRFIFWGYKATELYPSTGNPFGYLGQQRTAPATNRLPNKYELHPSIGDISGAKNSLNSNSRMEQNWKEEKIAEERGGICLFQLHMHFEMLNYFFN